VGPEWIIKVKCLFLSIIISKTCGAPLHLNAKFCSQSFFSFIKGSHPYTNFNTHRFNSNFEIILSKDKRFSIVLSHLITPDNKLMKNHHYNWISQLELLFILMQYNLYYGENQCWEKEWDCSLDFILFKRVCNSLFYIWWILANLSRSWTVKFCI